MGEMADFANEYQEATLNEANEFINGRTTLQDAYDKGLINERGVEQFPQSVLDGAETPWNIDAQINDCLNNLKGF